jgi:hypothetical protein
VEDPHYAAMHRTHMAGCLPPYNIAQSRDVGREQRSVSRHMQRSCQTTRLTATGLIRMCMFNG